jgi:hypothetical protein
MTRAALPHRRPNVTLDTIWNAHLVTVTVGYDPATGAPLEVFANTQRGGDMQATIADACIVVSIALQHGVTPAALAKSLARVPAFVNGEETTAAASPIGAILAAIMEASP